MLIKILEEPRSNDILKVDGASGKIYVFRWERVHRAFTFKAESSDQVEDIFSRDGSSLKFAPVIEDVPTISKPPVPKEDPQRAPLAKMLEGVGVPSHPADTTAVLERMLRAYDKGRADAQEPAKEEAAEPENTESSDAEPSQPAKKKRGRPKKNS